MSGALGLDGIPIEREMEKEYHWEENSTKEIQVELFKEHMRKFSPEQILKRYKEIVALHNFLGLINRI